MAVTRVTAPWGAVYDIEHPDEAKEQDIFAYVQQNRDSLDALDLKPEGQEEIGIFETGLEVAKAPVRGFAKGLLSVPAGLAELADAATNTVGLEGLIDSGEENALVAFSRQGQRAIDESVLGRDPRTLNSYAVDVAEGLGSVATFLTPGAIGRAAGLAGKALQAAKVRGGIGIGAGLGIDQQQQMIADARARGIEVSQGEEDLATALSGVIGLSEVALPFRLFNRINKTAPEGFKQKAIATLKEALASGSTEAVQEAVAGVAQEAVAKGVYDETLEIGQSFADDFTVGGGVGVVADLITAAVGGRRNAAISDAQRTREELLRKQREESIRRTQEERQQSTVEKAVESVQPFDPAQVAPPEDLTDPDAMLAYARNISRQMGYAFPDKTRFFVQDTPQGAIVVDETGVQYGMPVPEIEQAYELAAQLDDQMVDQAVRNTIRTNLEVFADVSEDNMSTAIDYGRRILSPNENTIPDVILNDAAGTTEENGFAEMAIGPDGEPRFATLNEARRRKKKLTAAQKINAARIKKGLPETIDFTMEEVRSVLGDDVSALVDRERLSFGVRSVLAKKGPGENKLTRLLRAKNITSDLNSPEVGRLAKALTGKENVSEMNKDDRALFYQRLTALPRFSVPQKLPDFQPRIFTAEQYNRVIDAGAPTSVEDVLEAARIPETDPDRVKKAEAIIQTMKDKDVVQKPTLLLPAPEDYSELVTSARARLDRLGLKDIGVKISRSLEDGIEGQFDPFTKQIAIAVDAIDPDGTMDAAQRNARIGDVMGHELLHALRENDLFQQAEWSSLERAALTMQRPDGAGNYMDVAMANYADLNPTQQIEEAVSEMVRDALAGRLNIAGRPRTLIQRIVEFFKSMGSVLGGTKFDSLESVINRIESGEVGGRERGKIRTLLRTEEAASAVPTRLTGTIKKAMDRGDLDKEAVAAMIRLGVEQKVARGDVSPVTEIDGVQMAPAWIPRVKDARLYRVLKDPDVQKAKAEKMGFDPTFTWYHGTLSKSLIDEEVRLGLPTGFLGRGFYLTSSRYDAEGNYASIYGPDQANKLLNVRGSVAQQALEEIAMGDPDLLSLDLIETTGKMISAADEEVGAWDAATREDIDSLERSWEDYGEADFDLQELEAFLEDIDAYEGEYAEIFNAALDTVAGNTLGWDTSGLVFPIYTKGRFALIGRPEMNTINPDDPTLLGEVDPEYMERFRQLADIGASPTEFYQIVEDVVGEGYELENPNTLSTIQDMMVDRELKKDPLTTADVYEILKQNLGTVRLNDYEMDRFMDNYGELANTYSDVDMIGDLIARVFQELGFDGVDMYPGRTFANPFTGVMEHTEGQVHRILFNPASARSVDAEFDPARAAEPRLMASRQRRMGIAEQKRRQAEGVIGEAAQANSSGPTEAALKRGMMNQNLNDEMAALTDQAPQFYGFETPTYGFANRVLFNVADKFLSLKLVEESINKARRAAGLPPMDARASAYKGEESIPGKVGYEIRQFEEGDKKRLVDAIVDQGLTREEVDEFLILRHAIERNAQIRRINPDIEDAGAGMLNGKPLTDAYVKQRMAELYGMTMRDGVWVGGNEKASRLKRVAAISDKIIRDSVDRGVQGGLYKPEDADVLKGFYRYYVPLKGFGVEQSEENRDPVMISKPGTAGAGGNMSIRGPEGRRALGRESEAFSPLATLVADRERMVARAVKNKEFGQRLVKLIQDNPNPAYWEVFPPGTPVYIRALNSKGDTVNIRSASPDFAGQDGEFMGVKIGGEQYYVRINGDERLRKALVNLDADSSNFLVTNLGRLNRFLSFVNTSLNPEFVIGNFARDVQTAVYNIIAEQTMQDGRVEGKKIVRRVLKDTMPSIRTFYKGLIDESKLEGDDLRDFQQFMGAGAKADWFHSRPPEQAAQTIDNLIDMQKGTFTGDFRRRFNETKNFIEDLNSSVENGVRFASFKAARDAFLEEGIPEAEAIARAATLAKNLTVNFNRKGMQGNLLNSLYLFFNASVQGTMNFARGLNVFDPNSSRTKQAMVGSMVGFGAMTAMLAHLMSDDDEESGRSYYELIPDYIKERNIVIMKPDGQNYWTIPLPYGYNVFHVAGAMLYESNAGIRSNINAAGMTTGAFLGSFNPIGFSGSNDFFTSVVKTGVPTAGLPVVELLANENFFGAPIYRENLPFGTQVPDSQLTYSTTPEAFKLVAGFLNDVTLGNENEPGFIDISPDTLNYMYEYALGGAGATAMRTFEVGRRAVTGEDIEVGQIPFIRRITGEPQVREMVGEYYDRSTSIQRKMAQLGILRGEDRAAYLERNRDYIQMEPARKAIDRQLKALRERLRDIEAYAETSPEAAIKARDLREAIEEQIDYQYARFNKLFDERVGRTKM
jgi:hypothetical protein